MRKIIKGMAAVLITAAVLFLLHFVLTLDAADQWLTGMFRKEEKASGSLIFTGRSSEKYETAEYASLPCIFARDGALLLAVGAETYDVTPENINISYYGQFLDFNDMISSRENCVVSKDGRYIVYRLFFNEIPYLYYFDTTEQKAFFVSDRTDSFDVVENDGTDALTLLYATGYDQSNKLFMYRSDDTGATAGSSTLISENNRVSGVFEEYGAVVYLSLKGGLFRYDVASGETQLLSSSVEEVYFPGDERYNYDVYYKDFTVCCRKAGEDRILNGSAEAPISGGYYDVIPKYTVDGRDGTLYYFSLKNRRLIQVRDGAETVLYEELGDLYHIFTYLRAPENGGTGSFVAAAGDSLYLLREDGKNSTRLLRLPNRYRKQIGMLERHMRVYPQNENLFLINLLSSGSLVWNTKNTDSWMNRASSYTYGLLSVSRNRAEESFSCEALDVPVSRRMEAPAALSANSGKRLWISRFADGSVKSAALISEEGRLLYRDLLGTSGFAEGQCDLTVYPCGTGSYFLRVLPGKRDFFLLSGDAEQLSPVMDEKGIFTEYYGSFSAGVSFGTLVIF